MAKRKYEISFQTWGSGDRIFLMLHGWGGSHRTFLPIRGFIPPDSTVYVPDLPGYGKSTAPDDIKLEEFATAIIDQTPIISNDKPISIVGNCSGGAIGAEIAKIHPKIIQRLFILDPFAYVPWYFKIFLAGQFGKNAYLATFGSSIGRYLTNRSLKSKRSGDVNLTSSFKNIDHEVSYKFFKMLCAVVAKDRYSNIDVPTELIYGEKTFGVVKSSITMLSNIWPEAQVRQLDGVGHLPIEEAPKKLASLVFAN